MILNQLRWVLLRKITLYISELLSSTQSTDLRELVVSCLRLHPSVYKKRKKEQKRKIMKYILYNVILAVKYGKPKLNRI